MHTWSFSQEIKNIVDWFISDHLAYYVCWSYHRNMETQAHTTRIPRISWVLRVLVTWDHYIKSLWWKRTSFVCQAIVMCISPSGQCSVLILKLKKKYDQKARDWKVLRLTIGLLDKTSFFKKNSADVFIKSIEEIYSHYESILTC